MAKDTIVFQTTDTFKEEIATYAQNAGVSVAEVIRRAVAEYINYDLDGEPSVERRRKYATIEERNAAMRQRAKDRRRDEREILEAWRRAQREGDIAAIRESLAAKGFDFANAD